MNKLGYGLLSLLASEPLSGYDLTRRLRRFWPSAHSAVYPQLAMLEEAGHVSGRVVNQNSRPDKKVYEITGTGRAALLDWARRPSDRPVVRDEALLKVAALDQLERPVALAVLHDLEERYRLQIEEFAAQLADGWPDADRNPPSSSSRNFGLFVLLRKVTDDAETGLRWVQWIRRSYGP